MIFLILYFTILHSLWLLNAGITFLKVKQKIGQCFQYVLGIISLVVQFSRSAVSDSVTPRMAARQASQSFTNSQGLLKFMSIDLVMPSNHLILCCPLLLLPSVFPRIKVFSSESVLHIRWPKYWSFSINLSSEYSELISFRIDWFDLFCSPVCRREEQITSTQSYFCS